MSIQEQSPVSHTNDFTDIQHPSPTEEYTAPDHQPRFTRRQFLKGAAVVAVGAIVEPLAKYVPTAEAGKETPRPGTVLSTSIVEIPRHNEPVVAIDVDTHGAYLASMGDRQGNLVVAAVTPEGLNRQDFGDNGVSRISFGDHFMDKGTAPSDKRPNTLLAQGMGVHTDGKGNVTVIGSVAKMAGDRPSFGIGFVRLDQHGREVRGSKAVLQLDGTPERPIQDLEVYRTVPLSEGRYAVLGGRTLKKLPTESQAKQKAFILILNPDGTPDTRFAGSGVTIRPSERYYQKACDIVELEDGSLMVGGTYGIDRYEASGEPIYRVDSIDAFMSLARGRDRVFASINGAALGSFNPDLQSGVYTAQEALGNRWTQVPMPIGVGINDISANAGDVVWTGSMYVPDRTEPQLAVGRLGPDLKPDMQFGDYGFATVPQFPSGSGHAVRVQGSQLYVAGRSSYSQGHVAYARIQG